MAKIDPFAWLFAFLYIGIDGHFIRPYSFWTPKDQTWKSKENTLISLKMCVVVTAKIKKYLKGGIRIPGLMMNLKKMRSY